MLSFVVAVISTQMSHPWTLWPKFLPLTTLTINSPVILLFEMTIVLHFGLEKSSITISVHLWTHLKWCSFAHSMKLWRNPCLSLLFKRKLISKSNSAWAIESGISIMASNIYGPAYSQGIKSLFLTSFFSITPSIFLKDTVAMFYFNLISVTGLMMYGSLISLTISPGFSFSTSKRLAKFPEQFIRLNSSRVDGITKMQGI